MLGHTVDPKLLSLAMEVSSSSSSSSSSRSPLLLPVTDSSLAHAQLQQRLLTASPLPRLPQATAVQGPQEGIVRQHSHHGQGLKPHRSLVVMEGGLRGPWLLRLGIISSSSNSSSTVAHRCKIFALASAVLTIPTVYPAGCGLKNLVCSVSVFEPNFSIVDNNHLSIFRYKTVHLCSAW